MAIDKAVDSAVLDANLTSIADAIRAKAGTSSKLAFPAGFAEAIAGIDAAIDAVDMGPFTYIVAGTYIPSEDVTEITMPEFSFPDSWNGSGGDKFILAIAGKWRSATGEYLRVGIDCGTSRICLYENGEKSTYYPRLKGGGGLSFSGVGLSAGWEYRYIFARTE